MRGTASRFLSANSRHQGYLRATTRRGGSIHLSPPTDTFRSVVATFDLAGQPDASFDTDGVATLSTLNSLAVLGGEGQFVLAGYDLTKPSSYSDSYRIPRLVTVTSSGTIDTAWAFSRTGRWTVHSERRVCFSRRLQAGSVVCSRWPGTETTHSGLGALRTCWGERAVQDAACFVSMC
jgi:hypothetical protein